MVRAFYLVERDMIFKSLMKRKKMNTVTNEAVIIPPEKLVFIPLGGSDEVGMNCFYMGIRANG